MIDFEYSLELAKYLIIYPILVITSLSAIYTFLVRSYDNFQRNKSKSLDVRICKCGGLYYGDRTKNGINHMEINGNLFPSVDVVDVVHDKKIKSSLSSKTEPKIVNLNNNNQNVRSRNKINDDSIALKNVHNRHVVSAMKEKFEHVNGEQSPMNVRTSSPARNLTHNRTPVKTNLLKFFNGEGLTTTVTPKSDENVTRRVLRGVNRIKTRSPTETVEPVRSNRLSQCSITELLDQLSDQSELQELCKEFVENGPTGLRPSQMTNGNMESVSEDPVQLRQKSISVENLLGSKRLSLYSSSPTSSSRRTSRPLSTENLRSLRRTLSQKSISLSNPNLNDILTQEIYDAILQSKNFDTAISFDDLLHADELSRCLSEYSITELLKDVSLEEDLETEDIATS